MVKDEHIDPVELTAYVDDQLDHARRIVVERWLSRHPYETAQIMADLQLRSELRYGLAADSVSASADTERLARRLGGDLRRQHWLRRARPMAAASMLVVIGWLAHDQMGSTSAWASGAVPDYVSAAVEAHHITELRASMASQVQTTEYDPTELLARTGLKLPRLPASWSITDVQVYPSARGPSVEVAVQTDEFGLLSIFAARPGPFLIMPPRTKDVEDTTTTYWQLGDTAYALVANGHHDNFSVAAAALFEELR